MLNVAWGCRGVLCPIFRQRLSQVVHRAQQQLELLVSQIQARCNLGAARVQRSQLRVQPIALTARPQCARARVCVCERVGVSVGAQGGEGGARARTCAFAIAAAAGSPPWPGPHTPAAGASPSARGPVLSGVHQWSRLRQPLQPLCSRASGTPGEGALVRGAARRVARTNLATNVLIVSQLHVTGLEHGRSGGHGELERVRLRDQVFRCAIAAGEGISAPPLTLTKHACTHMGASAASRVLATSFAAACATRVMDGSLMAVNSRVTSLL